MSCSTVGYDLNGRPIEARAYRARVNTSSCTETVRTAKIGDLKIWNRESASYESVTQAILEHSTFTGKAGEDLKEGDIVRYVYPGAIEKVSGWQGMQPFYVEPERDPETEVYYSFYGEGKAGIIVYQTISNGEYYLGALKLDSSDQLYVKTTFNIHSQVNGWTNMMMSLCGNIFVFSGVHENKIKAISITFNSANNTLFVSNTQILNSRTLNTNPKYIIISGGSSTLLFYLELSGTVMYQNVLDRTGDVISAIVDDVEAFSIDESITVTSSTNLSYFVYETEFRICYQNFMTRNIPNDISTFLLGRQIPHLTNVYTLQFAFVRGDEGVDEVVTQTVPGMIAFGRTAEGKCGAVFLREGDNEVLIVKDTKLNEELPGHEYTYVGVVRSDDFESFRSKRERIVVFYSDLESFTGAFYIETDLKGTELVISQPSITHQCFPVFQSIGSNYDKGLRIMTVNELDRIPFFLSSIEAAHGFNYFHLYPFLGNNWIGAVAEDAAKDEQAVVNVRGSVHKKQSNLTPGATYSLHPDTGQLVHSVSNAHVCTIGMALSPTDIFLSHPFASS